jgi:hypothetical protein
MDRQNKRMAKYAVVGAIVAIPIPFIGPILGAAAGAGYAWYKNGQERGEAPRANRRY